LEIVGYTPVTGGYESSTLAEWHTTSFEFPNKRRMEWYSNLLAEGVEIPCKALYKCITKYCNGKTRKKNFEVDGILKLNAGYISTSNYTNEYEWLGVSCEHSKEACNEKCPPFYRPLQ
jgi:hypothetical protein